MAATRILLLGPPKVEQAGEPVELPRRKALALLAYFAVAGRRQTREALAALLWPEADAASAHAYLRTAVWVLKRSPLRPSITAGRDHIELAKAPAVWIDTEAFRSLTAPTRGVLPPGAEVPEAWIAPLSAAVDLYRDDFLAGFHLGDNLVFDEWLGRQQDMLRAELAGALEKLARFHRRRRCFDQAIVHARRLLALDPFNEHVLRKLMDLHARAGQRGLALDLYEASEQLFRQELDLLPSVRTRELQRRILAGEIATAEPRPAMRAPGPRLVAPATPLVGREAELAEIRSMVASPGERLLTLVGVGGAGKTRLALEAAAEHAGRAADGTFFVPLAPVSGIAFVVPAIIDALQAALPANEPIRGAADECGRERDQLFDYLREKEILLVLDNLEHLPEVGELVADLLRHAPQVKVIATSRERLRVAGERILPLGGLPWPRDDAPEPDWESYDAIRLFRSEAARAAGSAPPAAAATVRICRAVEGNPLAIEIAASWTRTLAVEEIAREMESGLGFLVSRRRDAPARHRSIRAVFDHSWRLLTRPERACLRRLAVFHGGFSRRSAQEVAGASLDLLTALVEKSLVARRARDRFELHELVRQYAEDRLRANRRECARAHDRHSRHYLGWLARLERPLTGRGQEAALDQLAEQSGNLRTAWLWAARHGAVVRLHAATFAYFLFHDIRSRFSEGARLFGAAASVLGARSDRTGRVTRGALLVGQGWFVRHASRRRSRGLLRRGHALLEDLGPTPELGLAKVLATIESAWRERASVRHELRRAVEIYRGARHAWGEALALEVLCMATLRADPQAAAASARRCLALRRRAGDRWGVALSFFALGALAEAQGDDESARRRYEESAQIRREMGQDVDGLSHCLEALARVARRLGAFEEVLRLCSEWLRLARDLGSRSGVASALRMIALAQADLGRHAEARGGLLEALRLCEALDDDGACAVTLALLGNTAWSAGDREEARYRLRPEQVDRKAYLANHEPADRWKWLGWARLARADGRTEEARDNLRRAATECLQEKDAATLLEVLVEAAALLQATGAVERATELMGLVLAHRALGPACRARARALLDEIARRLAPERLAAAVVRGERMDVATAVAAATDSGWPS